MIRNVSQPLHRSNPCRKSPLQRTAELFPRTTPTRRAALGAFASVAALAVPSLPALASPAADVDAPLFALLDRWRAASALCNEAEERFGEAETAAHIKPPAALIKTKADGGMFYPQKDPVGLPFSESAIRFLAGVVALTPPVWGDSDHLRAIVDRFVEVRDAHREHYAAVEAARQSAGYYEAETELKAARAAEEALRREVADARPRTLPGLLAKLSAVADAFGPLHTIEEETDFDDVENVSLDGLALTVLRDCSAIMGAAST